MERKVLTDNLRRLRSIKGINQTELAKRAGLSRPSYVAIENGDADPRSRTLIKIADSLGVQLADLFRPMPSLNCVRFRIHKTMTRREGNSREQLLLEIAQWLKDYNELEEMLKNKRKFLFEGYAGKDAVNAAAYARKMLDINKKPVRGICGLLEKAGIKIYLTDSALKQYFGLSVSAEDGGPAVCVRVGNDVSIERQIFTAAHEMGHLLLHKRSYNKEEVKENEKEEKSADVFASYFLMPQEEFIKEWDENKGMFFVDRVLHVKRIFKVSYKTLLVRLIENDIVDKKSAFQRFSVEYKQRYKHDLKNHFEPESVSKYEPEGLARADFMEDRLNRLVREAYEKELISMDRAAEILKISTVEMRELNNSWGMAVGRYT